MVRTQERAPNKDDEVWHAAHIQIHLKSHSTYERVHAYPMRKRIPSFLPLKKLYQFLHCYCFLCCHSANFVVLPNDVKTCGHTPTFPLRLSLTKNLYGHPNLKWIAWDLKSASTRIFIWETHFRLPERQNPNMSILYLGNPFTEKIIFWILLLEKMLNGY